VGAVSERRYAKLGQKGRTGRRWQGKVDEDRER